MTDGQILYEAKYPPYLKVVLWKDRHFGTPFEIKNPNSGVPWNLLTKYSRDSWESIAKGHNLVLSYHANYP